MMLSPEWRSRLFLAGATFMALWLGSAIAQGEYGWPSLVAVMLALFLLARWQPFPIGTVLLATAIIGYVVGNRGFAQLLLSSRFPLLPAEAVLLVAGGLLLAQSALRRELPFRIDALHLLLLAWLGYGCVRVVFDVRAFGFMALRDFALVYYVAFFFLGAEAGRDARRSRLLMNVVLGASVFAVGVNLLFERYPGFFLETLTFRGAPLIYFKGDLLGTFAAAASVLAFLRYEEGKRRGWLAVSLAMAAATAASGNRASMAGLFIAAVWLLAAGRWRFAAFVGGSGAIAVAIILAMASFTKTSWERTPLFGAYERAVSLVDPTGQRTYRGANSADKGDNNLFRTVWWQAVIEETVEENPYTGLGFGRDLADRFVRAYYPESSEEFNVRSPHNVLITIFARMGALGLLLFLAAIGVATVRTWRSLRAGPREAGPWCAVWVIFTSACFGVVLEGPMGAVVFWIVLGLAQASTAKSRSTAGEGGSSSPALASQDVALRAEGARG